MTTTAQPVLGGRTAVVAGLCLLLVAATRLVLIADVLRQAEPTANVFDEDAFYVLTVARNLAAGNGVSADGVSWTNGVQPLWTAIAAIPYLFTSTDRAAFLALYALSFLLWIGGAALFARLVCGALDPAAATGGAALFCAALFLSSPGLQVAFFNGLETGLYVVALLAIALLWGSQTGDRRALTVADGVGLGILLGAAIWVRNDAVMFAAVLLFVGLRREQQRDWRPILLAGLVAVLLVAPWLLYNFALDGSVVPQSGRATQIGPNFRPLNLAKIVESARVVAVLAFPPMLPGAARLPAGVAIAVGGVFAIGLIVLVRRLHPQIAAAELSRVGGVFGAGLVLLLLYYVVASGAVWMFPRYFAPLELAFLALWALVLLGVARRRGVTQALPAASLLLATTACVNRGITWYGAQLPHMGPAVLALVDDRLCGGEAVRIGMFESGRAGYRCANVVNLDGKVNLEALHALEEHRLRAYVDDAHLDRLALRPYTASWLDEEYPGWRDWCEVTDGPGAELVWCSTVSRRARESGAG